MIEIKLSFSQVQRLMDAISWTVAPYLDDNSIQDKPWLIELADSYNELYNQIPSEENTYEPIIYERLS
ncbi:MAG: hypothetical protein M0Q53_07375 [Prolixibacteraceae bacterium]|jgi:hypothetical protein|nr:hypothetical protein [Prolixibacteraceae bacterium]